MRVQFVIPVLASILILGVLGSAPGAAAEPITFEFTGEVIQFECPCVIPPELSAIFSVGDTISGTYTFDSLAPDTNGDSVFGKYAIDDFSVTVGPVTYVAGPDPENFIFIAECN